MVWSTTSLTIAVLGVFAVVGLVRLAPLVGHIDWSGTATYPMAGRQRLRLRPRMQWRALSLVQVWERLAPVIECSAVVLFAMWVGRAYLDFNVGNWPDGTDFSLNVQGYFGWETFRQCGICVLWNGTLNGGAPQFAEILSAVAHPLVVAFVLLWGVFNALKITVVAGLAIAGLAQWWLGRTLGLSWVARLWSAAMAVVGGHLAGRMENGLVEVVFSAAACALVIPAILYLAQRGTRRATALLGVILALALLSGQGYMQLGLAFSVLPMTLLLVVDQKLQIRPVWVAFALAGLVAVLLTAYYWVPLFHFLPNIDKPTDPEFASTQPLAYLPLNLVVNDKSFFSAGALSMLPWPHLYVNYIGWVPILLVILGFRIIPRSGLRVMAFLLGSVMLIYLASSAITFNALRLIDIGPLSTWAAGVRFPSEIASLAIPPLLALAAWALDGLWRMAWPRIALSLASGKAIGINLGWLIVGVPLILAVRSAYLFGHEWLKIQTLPPEYQRVVTQVKPGSTAWVEAPYSDWNFVDFGLTNGMKITNAYRPWVWRDRTAPAPMLALTRDSSVSTTAEYAGQVEFVYLTNKPDNAYAYVQTDSARVPCSATAIGGNIDVTCQTQAPGQLIVSENMWSGWSVTRDGIGSGLSLGPWLSTAAPAGTHVYRFRYRPWDVAVGLLVTLVGLAWLLRLLIWKPDDQASAATIAFMIRIGLLRKTTST